MDIWRRMVLVPPSGPGACRWPRGSAGWPPIGRMAWLAERYL